MKTSQKHRNTDQTMRHAYLPLSSVVDEIFADVRQLDANVELRCFIDPGAQRAHVRDSFLHQPLYEVLLNAIRAARAGGILSTPHVLIMVVMMEDDWAEIHVDDSGKGFAVPFETACLAGVSLWEDGTRMGFGLPTAESMLEMIGGSLQQTTGYLGGARVTLRFPLHPASNPPDAPSANP